MAAEATRSVLVHTNTAITRCCYAAALSRFLARAFGLIAEGASAVTTHGLSFWAQFLAGEGHGRFTLAYVECRDCSITIA